MKPLKASDIVAIREAFSFSRIDFGALFYVTEETVNMWESSDEYADSIAGIHRELLARLRFQISVYQSVADGSGELFGVIARDVKEQISNTPNLCIPMFTLLRRLNLGE